VDAEGPAAVGADAGADQDATGEGAPEQVEST
jgi:hypothetical protein